MCPGTASLCAPTPTIDGRTVAALGPVRAARPPQDSGPSPMLWSSLSGPLGSAVACPSLSQRPARPLSGVTVRAFAALRPLRAAQSLISAPVRRSCSSPPCSLLHGLRSTTLALCSPLPFPLKKSTLPRLASPLTIVCPSMAPPQTAATRSNAALASFLGLPEPIRWSSRSTSCRCLRLDGHAHGKTVVPSFLAGLPSRRLRHDARCYLFRQSRFLQPVLHPRMSGI